MRKEDLKISNLYIYPVKSLGGIEVPEIHLNEKGPVLDRRWMLVDEDNTFMSQRKFPKMACLQTEIKQDKLVVRNRKLPEEYIDIPFDYNNDKGFFANIWADKTLAFEVNPFISEWFSAQLKKKCKLVHVPESSKRTRQSSNTEFQVGFADGYPFLVIGEASLGDLNKRLEQAVPMNRFRPNIVFSGGKAYEEDSWKEFEIGNTRFMGIKPCPRCNIPTIDQESGKSAGKEPIKTLAGYRKKENGILFGLNAISTQYTGSIKTGDLLKVKEQNT